MGSARSAAAEAFKKTDASGAKRNRHESSGAKRNRNEEPGSEVKEEVKRQRVAVADKHSMKPEDDGNLSESGSEGLQLVKPCCLSPSMSRLQQLLNACRSVFTGSSCTPPTTASGVAFIRGILDKIGPNDVGLKDEIRFFNRMNTAGRQNPPIITCKPIYEGTTFTIAVFFLPLGAVMPLHDHPGMTVFTKLLIGSAHLEAYDWVRPCAFSNGLGSRSHRQMLAEKVRDHNVVAGASSAWVLFPNHGGNMHRFTAAEDTHCAFLDVLTPPMDQRRCTYYRDFEFSDEHHRKSKATVAVSNRLITTDQMPRLAWLEEVPQPRDLTVVCLPFRGPRIF